jgi:predicted O-methyltransferase YrrM
VTLPPLLEQIYATGEVETVEGDRRAAEPVGVPRAHALRLAELVRDEGLTSTLETGLAYGLSALAIAGVHEERGEGRHIAIDPAASRYYESIGVENLRRAGIDERVRLIEAGSQLALPHLLDEGVELDFAFIDGMHLFDYALLDFFYVDRMLATDGYVVFHDTWMPAVQDAVGFVVTNRHYDLVPGTDSGMAVLRKLGPDRRLWSHYRPFARVRAVPGERSGDEEARDLLTTLGDGAAQAAERTGGFRDHDVVLAGRRVRLRFAGAALEPALLPAFAHALDGAGAGATPDLEVVLWDSASSGLPEPDVPWALGDVRARGDVRGYDDGPISVFSEPASGAVTAFDREHGRIAYWVVDARVVPWYERGAPLRSALHQWAAEGGQHFVHAAAVGADAGGVLLAGASGSGKSTLALACAEAGLGYAGDDYVILDDGTPPRAHCLYSTAKLDTEALARLPSLEPAVIEFRRGDEHKAVLDVHAHRPDRIRGAIAVRAIVLPVVGAEPGVRRATAAQALRALAPTTLLQLPGAAQARMTAMAGLVRTLPAFRLGLGDDLAAAAASVARICADPGAARDSADRQG